MAFDGWRRERSIRRTLRALSRQRVVGVLEPDNVLVIERAPPHSEELQASLHTCHLRGWVEPVFNVVPHGRLTPDGKLPAGHLFDDTRPVYRLTEGGWLVLHRSHSWVVATFVVATATLVASLLGVWLTRRP